MARLGALRAVIERDRGVVYVEFLIAFIPLFIVVLWICQLAFIASAKAVVEHSAWAAARSAVVVLEDNPARYGGIPRGTQRLSTQQYVPGIAEVMTVMAIDAGAFKQGATMAVHEILNNIKGNGMNRMTTIRSAAYVPLLPLANTELANRHHTIRNAIHDRFAAKLTAALAFTRAATAITLHSKPDNEDVAESPFLANADVTARVVYLYSCDVPVVRTLMCQSLSSLLLNGDRVAVNALKAAEDASGLARQLSSGGRFTLLVGKATLVNQGALYEER